MLIKPNQAGTVTEAKAALDAAREAGWGAIVSARSGETEDVTIVHLAVGWGAGQLKVGSFARSERMAKWNEALRIEEALGLPRPLRRRSAAAGARIGASASAVALNFIAIPAKAGISTTRWRVNGSGFRSYCDFSAAALSGRRLAGPGPGPLLRTKLQSPPARRRGMTAPGAVAGRLPTVRPLSRSLLETRINAAWAFCLPRRRRRDLCTCRAGRDAEAWRHADLHDPGRCAAELRRASRKHLRDDPFGRAVLQHADPGQPGKPGRRTSSSAISAPRCRQPTDDGKTYTFKIQPGVKFHDGTPLTSADVVASWNQIIFPPEGIVSPRQGYFMMVDKVEAPDPETVVFRLKFPTTAFLPALADPFAFIYEKQILDKDPHWYEKNVMGSGPVQVRRL